MNKKTILAYVLIGLVVIGFFKVNQKSPEDVKQEQAYNARIAQEKQLKQAAEKEQARIIQERYDSLKNDTSSIFHSVYNGDTMYVSQFTFPPTVQKGSIFYTPSPTFIVCRFCDDFHSDWCDM